MKGIVGGSLLGAGVWAFIFSAVFGSGKLAALGFAFLALGICWLTRTTGGEDDSHE